MGTGRPAQEGGLTGAAYAFDLKQAFGYGLTGKARITCEKDRPGRVRPHLGDKKLVGDVVLESHPDGGVIHHLDEPSASTAPPAELVSKILGHLGVYPGETKRGLRDLGNSSAVDATV
jgi:hypothetical protein